MNMNIDQTRLAILTMELEVKVKEYKKLCSILDEMKKENISPNDGKLITLRNLFENNYNDIAEINKEISSIS